MILCSMLLVSAVGYASDGDQTTKSKVVIVGADNLHDAIFLAAEMGMEVTFVASDGFNASPEVLVLDELMAQKEATFDDLCNNLILSANIDLYFDLPIDVGLTANRYATEKHNKSAYNSKINTFNSSLFKSDLLRSNSGCRC